MSIAAALDSLADALAADLGDQIPVTRDPAQVRAHIASHGLCVLLMPAQVAGRTHGGVLLDVDVALVLPSTDSMADNDRAYPALVTLLDATGQDRSTRAVVTLGADMYPSHQITIRIGADT